MADKKISELTAYTPAVDVDLVPIVDTTAGITKHITWANIKATLKTYFDSLTTTLTNKTLTDPIINGDITGDSELPVKTYEGKKYAIVNPYKNGGSLHLKGQLHCHTTNSDGADTASALVTAYKNAGYDFITITDHDYITADPAVAGITWLGTSCEESMPRHLTAYDIDTQYTGKNTQDCIDFHRANNKMVSLAHPNWGHANYIILDEVEIKGLHDFNFLEIYNGTTDTYAYDQFDNALSSGKKVFGLSTDDCHNVATSSEFNNGWVVVHTDTNSKATILQSLREGNFYASNGNDISISVAGNIITASSVGSSNFTFYGRNGRVLKTENGVTSSDYTILGDEMYVRVNSVLVADSTIAWSQPVFIDILGDDDEGLAEIRSLSYNNSLSRQAIINGNFDVWQRGTTYTNPGHLVFPGADRWETLVDGSGFPSNIIHSRQIITSGAVPGAFYCYRVAPDGAGNIATMALYRVQQNIENATRLLCGDGKKVTVSFWAKSDIANKKIGVYLTQSYGKGGSPSTAENIFGTNWTLTSYWKKYTHTFTTNTLAGKTFGTNNDDFITFYFCYAWNTTYDERVGATTAEDFVGSGTIDIAQVQFCAGDVALPFMPKSFEEELRACQRYYEKSFAYATVPANGASTTTIADVNSASFVPTINFGVTTIPFQVKKRVTPTVVMYGNSNGKPVYYSAQGVFSADTGGGLTALSENFMGFAQGSVNNTFIIDVVHWTASAEL